MSGAGGNGIGLHAGLPDPARRSRSRQARHRPLIAIGGESRSRERCELVPLIEGVFSAIVSHALRSHLSQVHAFPRAM
jgi:hypothetical protein